MHSLGSCLIPKPAADECSNAMKRKAKVTPAAKLPWPLGRESLLAQAKITRSFEPVARRNAVTKLVRESVRSRLCTSVEIMEADPQGHQYWELWLFEPLPIDQFVELLALDIAATNGVSALDRYLLQIFERLRAAAEAGEAWFIGDPSPLFTEPWSSLTLRDSALAVRPREAVAWMCHNPNARHLVPATPAQIAASIVSVNSPSPVCASPVVVAAGSVGPANAQGPMGVWESSESALDAGIAALGNPLPADRPAVAHVRRRGPRPTKLEETKDKMTCDIREGRVTPATLNNMLEKDLTARYGVSRDTARKARHAVSSKIADNLIPDK